MKIKACAQSLESTLFNLKRTTLSQLTLARLKETTCPSQLLNSRRASLASTLLGSPVTKMKITFKKQIGNTRVAIHLDRTQDTKNKAYELVSTIYSSRRCLSHLEERILSLYSASSQCSARMILLKRRRIVTWMSTQGQWCPTTSHVRTIKNR